MPAGSAPSAPRVRPRLLPRTWRVPGGATSGPPNPGPHNRWIDTQLSCSVVPWPACALQRHEGTDGSVVPSRTLPSPRAAPALSLCCRLCQESSSSACTWLLALSHSSFSAQVVPFAGDLSRNSKVVPHPHPPPLALSCRRVCVLGPPPPRLRRCGLSALLTTAYKARGLSRLSFCWWLCVWHPARRHMEGAGLNFLWHVGNEDTTHSQTLL